MTPARQSLLASLGFSCGFAASFNAPLAGGFVTCFWAKSALSNVSLNIWILNVMYMYNNTKSKYKVRIH